MRDEAIGVGQLPRREGVGREPLVDERERRRAERVPQILVEAAHLIAEQKALIDDRARRQRRHVEARQAGQVMLFSKRDQRVLRLFADGEELAFKRVLVRAVFPATDDELADDRHLLDHSFAEACRVRRHITPADYGLAFLDAEIFKVLHAKVARSFILREEAHGDGIVTGCGKRDLGACRPVAEQRIGDLNEDARAVAQQWVGANGTAMVDVDENFEAAFDGFVRFHAFNIGNKADTARIMFVARVIKTLIRWKPKFAQKNLQHWPQP